MGYRSEVAIVLEKEVYEKALEEAMQYKLENGKEDKYWCLLHTDKTSVDKKYAVLYWDWIKWYESYEEIKFIEELMKEHNAYFMRIGEEDSDIETHFYGEDYDMCDCISLCRSIDVNI